MSPAERAFFHSVIEKLAEYFYEAGFEDASLKRVRRTEFKLTKLNKLELDTRCAMFVRDSYQKPPKKV